MALNEQAVIDVSALIDYLQKRKLIAAAKAPPKKEVTKPIAASAAWNLSNDVVRIQKLLVHNDIKTTLRYLHVTNKDLSKIVSPIEDITSLLK
ncbi:MAG: hypothetical protein M3Y85_08800 [Bacteroidota bacterium]|nr:hypothetical protein [Bacteroidota bacterium]